MTVWMKPTGNSSPKRREEPAPPAIGVPRPHHHEKQRNHENRGHDAGDLRRPIGLPRMRKHEQRPERDRQGQQNGFSRASGCGLSQP